MHNLLYYILLFSFFCFSTNVFSQKITVQKIDKTAIYVYSGMILTAGSGSLIYYKYNRLGLSLGGGFLTPIIVGFGEKSVYSIFRLGQYNNQNIFNLFWGGTIGTVSLAIGINVYETKQIDKEYYRTLRINVLPDSLRYGIPIPKDTLK